MDEMVISQMDTSRRLLGKVRSWGATGYQWKKEEGVRRIGIGGEEVGFGLVWGNRWDSPTSRGVWCWIVRFLWVGTSRDICTAAVNSSTPTQLHPPLPRIRHTHTETCAYSRSYFIACDRPPWLFSSSWKNACESVAMIHVLVLLKINISSVIVSG